MAEKLGRSVSAVQQRANKFGLKKSKPSAWSKGELEYLKTSFEDTSYEEIRKHLGRSLPSIYNKVYELGLSSKDAKYQKLKYTQRQFILNNYHVMTDAELSRKLGVSTDAIADFRKKNGIKKNPNSGPKRMTEPEKKVKALLDELGVSYEYGSSYNGYYPDYLLDKKAVIEVQGDYYHCNPKLYPNGPSEAQIDYIVKDYYKKCFYEGNNIPNLYIWEHDINTDWSEVERKIQNFCRPFEKSSGESVEKIGKDCEVDAEVTDEIKMSLAP
jgi:G:T-mismatch repair DNA endonuclease (very short patch repair protein)